MTQPPLPLRKRKRYTPFAIRYVLHITAVITILCTVAALPAASRAESGPIYRDGKLVKRFHLKKRNLYNKLLIISPDGRHIIHVATEEKTYRGIIQVDDFYLGNHLMLFRDRIQVARGGAVIYTYRDNSDIPISAAVILNDRSRRTFRDIDREIKLSPRGDDFMCIDNVHIYNRPVYLHTKKKKYGPGGIKKKHIDCNGLYYFNNEGSLRGFVYYGGNEKKYCVRVQDTIYEGLEDVHQLAFSSQGRHYAFVHEKTEAKKRSYYCNVDGTTYGPYPEMIQAHFSDDGTRHCLTSRHNFYYGTIRHGPYDNIFDPVISNDGRDYMFTFARKSEEDRQYNAALEREQGCNNMKACCTLSWIGGWARGTYDSRGPRTSIYILHNGKEHDPSKAMFRIRTRHNTTKVVYSESRDNGGSTILYNNKIMGWGDSVSHIALSSDGAHMTYYFRKDGRDFIFRDGVTYPMGEGNYFVTKSGITDDGKLCCVLYGDSESRGKARFVSVNGKGYGPFEALDFTIEGNSVYVAITAGNRVDIIRF
ncbi:MAG TPA: hypothetical protein PK544_18420 [Spirochaetota bacterium]|nr:hypothetical protein [Spirochaetota bacterium]